MISRGGVFVAQRNQDIKVRVLPRSNSRANLGAARPLSVAPVQVNGNWSHKWLAYLSAIVAFYFCYSVLQRIVSEPSVEDRTAQTRDPSSSSRQRANQSVTRHLQSSFIKEHAQRMRAENENLQTRDPYLEEAEGSQFEGATGYGLDLEQDDSAERLYRELNSVSSGNRAGTFDQMPDQRINARLANRRWLNDLERAERINFVRNFIRSAYERGYQVDLDSNLVVVGVRRIQNNQKVSIDQILERLSKQGF